MKGCISKAGSSMQPALRPYCVPGTALCIVGNASHRSGSCLPGVLSQASGMLKKNHGAPRRVRL